MKKIIYLFSSLYFLLISTGMAQSPEDSLAIARIKWNKQKIEKGVVWKQAHFDNLYQAPQEVNLLEIDLRKKKIDVDFAGIPDGLKITSGFIKDENAIGGINGSFFNISDGGSTTFLRIDGKVVNTTTMNKGKERSDRTNGAITIKRVNGRENIDILAAGLADSTWEAGIDAADVMVCGPLLLLDDAYVSLLKNEFNDNRHPRSAVALDGDKLILMTVDGRNNQSYGMSLPELAFFLKQIGAEKALNLDGGGSTTLVLNTAKKSGVLNYPSDNKEFDHEGERPVANVILIKKK